MLENASRRMGRAQPRITDAAWRALEKHAWPGNVRELSNLMERLAIYHAGREIDPDDLDLPPSLGDETIDRMETRSSTGSFPTAPAGSPSNIVLDVPEAGTTFDSLEKSILAQMLERHRGNQSAAARALGLSESTLRSRLKRLGLKS
jgi:DNA-binding NtrC family response regulator